MNPSDRQPPRPGSHPRLVVTETVEHSRRVDGPLPRPAFFPPAEPPTPAVRMPGAKEPPPAPQRGPRKETVAGGFVVPRSEHQAPQGEAFDGDEPDTAPAAPHALSVSSAPPRPSNPPPPDLAHRQSYADLAHEAAIAKAAAQEAREKLDALQAAELERQRFTPRVEIEARAPRGPSLSVSFGAAKWWTLVLAALAGVFHEMPKGLDALARFLNWPTHEQIEAQAKRSDEIEATAKKRQELDDKALAAAADQARIVEAVLCVQGVRADGLDCDVALARAKFEQQPLTGPNKVRGAPQWKTRLIWPQARAPPGE